jgi:hypothetical protein
MTNIPRLNGTQGQAVPITAVPLGDSWFEAWCGGQLIVARTREPLLDGARVLLAAGYHPDTIAVMRHAGSESDALTARIGTAAQFYIEESGHGPVLRSVRKASPGAVDRPPVAQVCRAIQHPHGARRVITAPAHHNDTERPAKGVGKGRVS